MFQLAAHIRFDGAPPEPARAAQILAAPAAARCVGPGFALAATRHEAFAAGTRAGESLALFFDGRIDDRAGLRRRLGEAADAGSHSDAALVLAAYVRFGEPAFESLVGPFVAVVVEEPGPTVVLARDPLGGRSLFLRRNGAELMLASRPSALLGSGGAPDRLDEVSLARYLAASGPLPGATFFRDIEELPAGAIVRFDRRGARARRIELRAEELPSGIRDRELEARLLERLDQAVEARLPASGGTAVLMSGGLDSTSVAAAAAARLAARGAAPPFAISWRFERLAGSDERTWIDAANRSIGSRPVSIVADDLYPLADLERWPRPIDSPVQGPFFWPRRRALAAAKEVGAPVLLAGESGDDLWVRGADWLRDLVLDGHLLGAARDLLRLGLLTARREPTAYSLRTSLGRLLRRPGPTTWQPPDWLTAEARGLLDPATEPGDPLWFPFREHEPVAHPLHLGLLRFAERESEPFDVEIRRPFRDRRLVEFLLAVPPRLHYRPGRSKLLLRRAASGRLPRAVLDRRQVTSLQPLFDLGVAERARDALRRVIDDPAALWPRFVRREWLEPRLLTAFRDPRRGIERLLLWHCWCVEIWQRRVRSRLESGAPIPISSDNPEARPG